MYNKGQINIFEFWVCVDIGIMRWWVPTELLVCLCLTYTDIIDKGGIQTNIIDDGCKYGW